MDIHPVGYFVLGMIVVCVLVTIYVVLSAPAGPRVEWEEKHGQGGERKQIHSSGQQHVKPGVGPPPTDPRKRRRYP